MLGSEELRKLQQGQFENEQLIKKLMRQQASLIDEVRELQACVKGLSAHHISPPPYPMDSQPVVTREYVSTLTEVPVETFDRDQLLASMALATTKGSDVDDFKTEHLPEPPLAMISSKIDEETQAMINLDKQYGINI